MEPPDCHYLSAAIGWLELGNPAESELELSQIREVNQESEAVLMTRWHIYEHQETWNKAQEIAARMRQAHPDNPFGYIHYAYSTRRISGGGLKAAWDALEPAAKLFPQEPIIPYNLACYAAQLKRQDEAWEWLTKAMAIGDKALLRKMALSDPDLVSIWPRLSAGPRKPDEG